MHVVRRMRVVMIGENGGCIKAGPHGSAGAGVVMNVCACPSIHAASTSRSESRSWHSMRRLVTVLAPATTTSRALRPPSLALRGASRISTTLARIDTSETHLSCTQTDLRRRRDVANSHRTRKRPNVPATVAVRVATTAHICLYAGLPANPTSSNASTRTSTHNDDYTRNGGSTDAPQERDSVHASVTHAEAIGGPLANADSLPCSNAGAHAAKSKWVTLRQRTALLSAWEHMEASPRRGCTVTRGTRHPQHHVATAPRPGGHSSQHRQPQKATHRLPPRHATRIPIAQSARADSRRLPANVRRFGPGSGGDSSGPGSRGGSGGASGRPGSDEGSGRGSSNDGGGDGGSGSSGNSGGGGNKRGWQRWCRECCDEVGGLGSSLKRNTNRI
jgi:hypothetical protein